MKYMYLKDLKLTFDLNKGKTISLNRNFYMDVYRDYNTTVSIYDKTIVDSEKVVAQISYNVDAQTVSLFLRSDGTLTSTNKMEYHMTDKVDNLNLSPELIKELKKYYRWRNLWKIKNKINQVLKKDK